LSRILVVGGYGTFGSRLCRRLASSAHHIVVAGRSREKAAALCGQLPGCEPAFFDRSKPDATLRDLAPEIVVDAAGPFQGSDYALAKACIAYGIHYVDLADAREFVTEIGTLDAEAVQAGACVVSGASSVPALSGAVVRELTAGLDRVTAVEIAISASSRATVGVSVLKAILGSVGKPFDVWSGGRWKRQHGWQSLRWERFQLPSGKSIGRRLVAPVDIPDLALLPERVAGRPAVVFRAGTENRAGMALLWIAAQLVRSGLLRSLRSAASPLARLHHLLGRRFGSDRSGMIVRVFGIGRGRRYERRWTLIAEHGYGPEIPTLAAALIVERICAGLMEPGARDAGAVLHLEDFDAAFSGPAVEAERQETPLPQCLYARVLGPEWPRLAPAVRSMHEVCRDRGASGSARVDRGTGLLARAIARMMAFPPAGDYDLHVHFEERAGVEKWTRDFGGHVFSSRLSASHDNHLVEAFGPLRFQFDLAAQNGRLEMKIRGWSLGPIALPRFLAPRSEAKEWADEDGNFHFDVPVWLPLIGLVVHYRGQLTP
jgi:NAD(P)-dependent dehydrogenase (short-subunit alcohol dehydrogenase family)